MAQSEHDVLLHELTALRRSEAVLRDFIETSTIGLHWVGADGTILWANQAELDLLDYAREEYVGRNIAEFHPDESVINDMLARLSRGETLRDYPARLRHHDGSTRHVLVNSSVLFEDGKFIHTRCFTRDVTALRESEERLRFAQQTARIGTFDWNIETGVNVWTTELEAMYGLPPGGFPGTQTAWEALVHPDDRQRAVERVTESLETGEPVEEEWRVIWPDGSIHWLAGRWQVFKNGLGNPVRLMGVNIDVTDRMQMEEALRRSEERLRLAIKATNDAIWDIDLKTGTVSRNDTYSMLYGSSETADSWQFWIDRIHPEDRARTVGEFRAALGSGASSWSGQYRFRRVDGEWAYIYDRADIARDESGNAWRVIGAMQDLTEQKHAEATLRASEERFRRVFDEGPLGVALVGRDHRFLRVNNALCQMLGYSEVELVQKTFADITHPDDVRADAELAERLFRCELSFYRLQKRYVKKNGEVIWVNLTKSLILDDQGEPLHGLTMVEDITEIKRTQEEALLRQKLESLGTLAGGIAHDFNNLLGAVQAQAELASAELDAGSSCKEELRAIGEVAIRGSEIVRQLMIYAGKEGAVVGLVDLSKTVDEMLSLLKVSVTKHAVIEINLDRDLPAIHASDAQIRQMVMNLIANASDAIGERDGVIRVSTRRVTRTGESAVAGDHVQLEVSDTGRGMSVETQAKVFDPFFTTKSAGRGLGLAVVQGIVRNLDGAINLTSEPDKGTTFQVLLPCPATTAEAIGQVISRDGEMAASQHGTVLVVEDEGYLRQAVVKMLRNTGFEVFEAADSFSAIDILRASGSAIDVILLDVTLPGASTHEIIAEAANARLNMRVILTSAYSQEMIVDAMDSPQIRGFIRKPFQLGELVQKLRVPQVS
jgi:PAS domain S-box-containing protein